MKKTLTLLACLFAFGCTEKKRAEPPRLSEKEEVLKLVLEKRIHETEHVGDQVKKWNGGRRLERNIKAVLLVDTMLQNLDSTIIKRSVVYPDARRETIRSLIENDKSREIFDYKKVLDGISIIPTDSIEVLKHYPGFANGSSKKMKDTIFVALRLCRPGFSKDGKEAIVPYLFYDMVGFSILKKDTTWNMTELRDPSVY